MTRKWRTRLDLLWPLALLVLFAATFRRTVPDPVAARPIAECGQERPVDVAALERCLDDDRDNIAVMTDLGDAYARSGAIDRAESIYRRALAIDPHDGDVHLRLGELMLKRGDRGAATREAEAAARWQPGSAAASRLADRASGESVR